MTACLGSSAAASRQASASRPSREGHQQRAQARAPAAKAPSQRRLVVVAAASESSSSYQFRGGAARGVSELQALLEAAAAPLDVAPLVKDMPRDATDAMRRTISGMLGLLPSSQFAVTLDADRESLARLLASSMMTGYTLRNAATRLALQRALDGSPATAGPAERDGDAGADVPPPWSPPRARPVGRFGPFVIPSAHPPYHPGGCAHAVEPPQEDLAAAPASVRAYLRALRREAADSAGQLRDAKRAAEAAAGGPGGAVAGADTVSASSLSSSNALLDYLRGLPADKVKALARPATQELEDALAAIVDGLLGTPGLAAGGGHGGGHLSACISAPRDFLARLLFYCMALGYTARGVEYQLELERDWRS